MSYPDALSLTSLCTWLVNWLLKVSVTLPFELGTKLATSGGGGAACWGGGGGAGAWWWPPDPLEA